MPELASETKTCKGPCGRTLPLEEFKPYRKADRPGKVYRRSECRKCNSALRLQWREENRERDNANKARWSRKRYATDAKWRAATIKRVNARTKERYQTDPEFRGLANARAREYRRGTAEYADAEVGGYVPVDPIRAAVEMAGVTPAEVSARLGLEASTIGKALRREQIQEATALRILRAVNIDPHMVGL